MKNRWYPNPKAMLLNNRSARTTIIVDRDVYKIWQSNSFKITDVYYVAEFEFFLFFFFFVFLWIEKNLRDRNCVDIVAFNIS